MVSHGWGICGVRRLMCGDTGTGFVRIVILLGALYEPYGWSGGGGRTSQMFSGSLIGALYSLDDGEIEHLMHESSDWMAPCCSVTVAYGSGGTELLRIFEMTVGVTSAYSAFRCEGGGAIECIGLIIVLPCSHIGCGLSGSEAVSIGPGYAAFMFRLLLHAHTSAKMAPQISDKPSIPSAAVDSHDVLHELTAGSDLSKRNDSSS